MIGLSLLFKFSFCIVTDACLFFKNAVTFLARLQKMWHLIWKTDRQQLFHDVLLYLTRPLLVVGIFCDRSLSFFRTLVLSFFRRTQNAFINALYQSCINCQAQNNIHCKLCIIRFRLTFWSNSFLPLICFFIVCQDYVLRVFSRSISFLTSWISLFLLSAYCLPS